MNSLIVIPARFASSRLPGKPLKDIAGQTLIERVWRQAIQVENTVVVVASDDQRILSHAANFGAKVVSTSTTARTGSDRVAEALDILQSQGQSFDFVANVQGDMPFIQPQVISKTISTLATAPKDIGITTIASPIYALQDFMRPDCVKVVIGANNRALYFSRQALPFARDGFESIIAEQQPLGFKHAGLYVFRPDVLKYFATLSSCEVEEREKLEQLRALAHGIGMNVAIVEAQEMHPSIEVDTEEDLERARKFAQG